MEKVILKSNSQEVAFNHKDSSICESFVYEPAELPDKKVGSLYILGHVEKRPGEDIGYILNLISSLMKREYYSDPNAGPKATFEKGLKKINEVLRDFFRDKETNLDLGILATSGDNMLVSKLGKFKILLFRESEFIDIFDNVGLFSKDRAQEEEFSNVVSGKLVANDTIFAYHPNRQIVSREGKIKDLIKVSATSADLVKKMGEMQSKSSFPCHALSISIEQIKEVASIPRPIISSTPGSELQRTGVKNILKDLPDIKRQEEKIVEESEESKISPAELSLVKRENGIDKLFSKTKTITLMKPTHKFIAGALVIAVAIIGFLSYRTLNKSADEFKVAKQMAENSLKEAEEKTAANNIRDARTALGAALTGLEQFRENKKAQQLIAEVEAKLQDLRKTSSEKAMLLADLSQEGVTATHVIKTPNSLYVFNKEDGSFNSLSSNLEKETVYVFVKPSNIHFTNEEKIFSKTLKEEGIVAGDFYADNFYFANSESIFKYTDVALKNTQKSNWLKEEMADIISLVVDNSVYALTSNGISIEYFGGKKVKEADLQINPSANASILTKKEHNELFVFDPDKKEIAVFSRENGSLIETHDISYIENPQSVSLGDSGELYILSSDNKIWKL